MMEACAARVRSNVTYQQTYASYKRVFKNWTRKTTIYQLFDTHLIVIALYKSHEFREAYAQEKSRAFQLSDEDRKRLIADEKLQEEAGYEFLFCAYTPKMGYNDLDSPNSSFKMWLIDYQGHRIQPGRIEPIRLPKSADLMFYPFVNEWSYYYRVLFPKTNEAGQSVDLSKGKIRLVLTGPEGRGELNWVLPD